MRRFVYNIIAIAIVLLSTDLAWGQTEVSGTWTGGTLSGSYKLKDNTYLTNTIVVAANTTLTVDLNGMVLSGKGISSIFDVKEKGSLTIKDSNPEVGHLGNINDQGIFVWPFSNGNYAVKGGIIHNPYENSSTDRKGILVSGTCTIERAKIMGCYSQDIGSAVTVTSTGSFTMKAGVVSYNYAKGTLSGSNSRGGVIYGEPEHSNQGAIISISNTEISNNRSDENGGAICAYKLTLNNCTLVDNVSAKEGGAVYVRNTAASSPNGYLTITGCTIGSNSATKGGGIAVHTECKILGKTIIEKNISTITGGGIYASNKLTIQGSSSQRVLISKNVSVTPTVFSNSDNGFKASTHGQGGGIYIPTTSLADVAKNNACTISYCNIVDNYAAVNGGGIMSGVNTTVSNSSILRNRAMSSELSTDPVSVNSGRGGGFYFHGYNKDGVVVRPVCILEHTNVENNASMWYGGGGQLGTSAILTISDGCSIDNNICVLKGAAGLHLTGSVTFNMEGGSISNNVTYGGVGGGIHSSYTCEINLTGGIIHNNIAYGRGGGVHVNTGGELVLNGTNITDNKAYDGYDLSYSTVTRNGDGTYSWTDPVSKSGEAFPGYGGGILINSGTCRMEKGTLSGNYADTFGGGIGLIMVEGSSDYASMMRVVKFTLNNGNVTNNTTSGNGGGVYLMRNIISELNESKKDIYPQDVQNGIPQVILNGGTISLNKSKGNGGGIYQEVNTKFLINSSLTLSENEAGYNAASGSGGSGGAVYIATGGSAEITKGKIIFNKNIANYGNGGGMYCAGSLNVSSSASCEITNNIGVNGGAVYLTGGNFISKGSSSIEGNKATTGNGGAIYVNAGQFSSASTTSMLSNSAGADGGAVYVKGEGNIKGNISITGNSTVLTLSGNSAAGNGGVFYVDAGSIDASNIYSASITDNYCNGEGGAFYVNNGNISMCKTELSGNGKSATGVKTVNGGAIALYNGIFSFADGSEIRNNAASGNGGALYVMNKTGTTSSISCSGGSYLNNSAGLGGGIYAYGPINLTFAANVRDNKALNGGGLYIDGGVNMSFGNGLIVGNSARFDANTVADGTQYGVGGGIYLAKGSLTFTETQNLGIYNNSASYEAADIYASGNSTTVNLPNISGMNLSGFEVPGSDLYWVMDYSTKRYETALRNNEDIETLILTFDDGESVKTLNSTQCLDLGYDLVFVTLSVAGLDESDNAAVTIAYPKTGVVDPVVYRKIVLTGSKQQIVGLPSNHWKFVATPWSSFKYKNPTYDPGHATTDDLQSNKKTGYIYIKRNINQNIAITFTKNQSASTNKTISYDAIKVNKMRPGGTM